MEQLQHLLVLLQERQHLLALSLHLAAHFCRTDDALEQQFVGIESLLRALGVLAKLLHTFGLLVAEAAHALLEVVLLDQQFLLLLLESFVLLIPLVLVLGALDCERFQVPLELVYAPVVTLDLGTLIRVLADLLHVVVLVLLGVVLELVLSLGEGVVELVQLGVESVLHLVELLRLLVLDGLRVVLVHFRVLLVAFHPLVVQQLEDLLHLLLLAVEPTVQLLHLVHLLAFEFVDRVLPLLLEFLDAFLLQLLQVALVLLVLLHCPALLGLRLLEVLVEHVHDGLAFLQELVKHWELVLYLLLELHCLLLAHDGAD